MIICQKGKGDASVPIEDICAIILESHQIVLTSALLSFFQNHDVVVITCDHKHIPNGVLTPFLQHSRFSEIAHLQNEWSLPFKKKCWKILVQQKIINQSKCLEITGNPFSKVRGFAEDVKAGDSRNIESLAARYYWKYLFSGNFKRKEDTIISSALNYGYSIVRAIICRAIVGYGLLPCFGLHHKNALNSFNLADDIIEPFRPIVDLYVWNLIKKFPHQTELTKEMRNDLLNLCILPCIIEKEIHQLHNASEFCVSSLVKSIRFNEPNLIKLPRLFYE